MSSTCWPWRTLPFILLQLVIIHPSLSVACAALQVFTSSSRFPAELIHAKLNVPVAQSTLCDPRPCVCCRMRRLAHVSDTLLQVAAYLYQAQVTSAALAMSCKLVLVREYSSRAVDVPSTLQRNTSHCTRLRSCCQRLDCSMHHHFFICPCCMCPMTGGTGWW